MSNFNVVPPGKYRAVAVEMNSEDGPVKAHFDTSSEAQTDYVQMNFEIRDGEHAGRRVFWKGYFTDTVMKSGETVSQRTMRSLRACGWKGEDLYQAPTQTLDIEVEIVVENETNSETGKTYAKVAWVNALGGGAFKVQGGMDRNRLRDFSARMKAVARAIPEVGGTPAPARPAGNGRSAPPAGKPQTRPVDDDTPF